jgi:hypothetical protein
MCINKSRKKKELCIRAINYTVKIKPTITTTTTTKRRKKIVRKKKPNKIKGNLIYNIEI